MKNAIVPANFSVACDHAMVADAGALIDFNVAIDDGVRAHTDTRTKFGARINNGGGMDAHVRFGFTLRLGYRALCA